MEEKLNKKLLYLHSMADKYEKLNQKTHYKYLMEFVNTFKH